MRPSPSAGVRLWRTDAAKDHTKILLAAITLTLVLPEAGSAEEPAVARGRHFAETHCAACHAIGRFGESPLAIAPPFRTLHQRYPVEHLAEALAEGIATGHPTMPQFQLEPDQINDFIRYLKTLEEAGVLPSAPRSGPDRTG